MSLLRSENYSLFTIHYKTEGFVREDGAGKRAKLESDGMRELKSDLGSSFNDLAAYALQLRTWRRRPTASLRADTPRLLFLSYAINKFNDKSIRIEFH